MNHGYDDEDDNDYEEMQPPPTARAGPSGLLAQLMNGGMAGMGGGFGPVGMMGMGYSAPPSAFDEYYKAYSVAVLGGPERYELMYGGKIIMPPSALARLTSYDIQGPWTFQLRNPRKPSTKLHSGVMEFIAEEGIVYLPSWMMKSLQIEEGDPIRVNGASLPKGKMVKIQAQELSFLEVSDPKAVLESALRNFNCLSPNTIIEITYNHLVFSFLIETVSPEGPGISVIDTDLSVEFSTPKGYVEPPRAAPKPIAGMKEKLNINLNETHGVGQGDSLGSTRPGSVASSARGSIADADQTFMGVGQSLSGRRVKGKGLAKKVEEVEGRTADTGPKIITPSSLADRDRKVPAALHLPAGKFFFGYTYVPFDPSKTAKKTQDPAVPTEQMPFGGSGNALRSGKSTGKQKADAGEVGDGRGGAAGSTQASGSGPGGGSAGAGGKEPEEKVDPWAKLGGGNTLRAPAPALAGGGSASRAQAGGSAQGGTRTPGKRERTSEEETGGRARLRGAATGGAGTGIAPEVVDATMLDEDDFWEVDEGSGEDEYGIDVDSD